MSREIKNRGKIVVAAGTGINLALGVLYTWSIFKGAIKQSIETGGAGAFTWGLESLNDPYAVCCLVFAFMMIVAGKCQDKLGPRLTATIGGLLVGVGFIWISQSTAYFAWVMGFGVLVGTGIAFGYSSATPPALKWFPPTRPAGSRVWWWPDSASPRSISLPWLNTFWSAMGCRNPCSFSASPFWSLSACWPSSCRIRRKGSSPRDLSTAAASVK